MGGDPEQMCWRDGALLGEGDAPCAGHTVRWNQAMPEGIISDQTLTGNFSFSYNSTLPTPNRTVLAEEYFEFQMLACLVEVGFCTPFNDLFVLGSDFYNATTCERATQDVR